jgi:hypothetical protein
MGGSGSSKVSMSGKHTHRAHCQHTQLTINSPWWCRVTVSEVVEMWVNVLLKQIHFWDAQHSSKKKAASSPFLACNDRWPLVEYTMSGLSYDGAI